VKPRHLICAAAALATLPATATAAEPIAGRWLTAEKDAIITIGKCGTSTCGRISKFLVPPPDGPDQRDINNPDPAKRSRRLLGIAILSGFRADGEVWRGQIYDPKSGRSYRSIIRRKGAGVLEVKGCFGPFCQTQLWTKAP
jgi:uncharacterized protein (DUF2147 family)